MDQQVNVLFLVLFDSVQHWFSIVLNFFFLVKKSFLELVKMLSLVHGREFYSTLLSGDKKLLNSKQNLLLEITGMQHLFSVSGMHLGMVIAGARVVLTRFLAKRTAFTLVVVVWIYAFLVNFRPSVLRASVMTSISLLAHRYLHRKVHGFYLLLLSVIFLVSFDSSLLSNIGFQLSVMGVTGVLVSQLFFRRSSIGDFFTGNLSNQFSTTSKPKNQLLHNVVAVFIETFVITFFVSLFIFPLILFYFGEVTFASLIANPLVLWLAPIVLAIGGVQLGLTAIKHWFVQLVPFVSLLDPLLDIPLKIMVFILESVALLPMPHLMLESFSLSALFLYYMFIVLVLIFLVFYKKKKMKYVVYF